MDKKIIDLINVLSGGLNKPESGSNNINDLMSKLAKEGKGIILDIPNDKLNDPNYILTVLEKALNEGKNVLGRSEMFKDLFEKKQESEETKTEDKVSEGTLDIIAENPYSFSCSPDGKGVVITIPLHGESLINTTIENESLTLLVRTEKVNLGTLNNKEIAFLNEKLPVNFSYTNRITIPIININDYDFESIKVIKNKNIFVMYIPFKEVNETFFNKTF